MGVWDSYQPLRVNIWCIDSTIENQEQNEIGGIDTQIAQICPDHYTTIYPEYVYCDI